MLVRLSRELCNVVKRLNSNVPKVNLVIVMRFPIFVALLLTPTLTFAAHNTNMKRLVESSETIVAGEIITEPIGEVDEIGVKYYLFKVRVTESLKGGTMVGKVILVTQERFEATDYEKPPHFVKGAKIVAFGGPISIGDSPHLSVSDAWFGVLRYTDTMAYHIKLMVKGG